MKRKKKKVLPPPLVWLVLIAVAIGLGAWAWQQRARLRTLFAEKTAPAADDAGRAARQQLRGRLEVVEPPRDADIDIVAPAVALLRDVAVYQWQERCSGDDCSYALAWSAQHIDSRKFRAPAGHENARAPFSSARFVAGELRIGEVVIDPGLALAQLAPVDYPVASSALPPNLAATFSVVDGVLYAGGDPAHPAAGMLRIGYRVVPAGDVELAGVRRGNRLEAQ